MALVSRVSIGKHSLNGLFNRLCKVPKYNNIQIAHITRGVNRIPKAKPPPFPYKEKSATSLQAYFDLGYARYDENTRLIVVEGPIAAGKDKFARELAIEFEMAYMPPPSFDIMYKYPYTIDLRSVDHLVPPLLQTCDLQKFLTNPEHINVPNFQLTYYVLKLQAYYETVLHILSTGEGVVMNRCAYSDIVFAQAMYNAGYINRRCFKYYKEVVANSLYAARPHLIIYLDVPVKVVKDNIKRRAIPYEANSKVLTTKYLTDIERIYKEEYLPKFESHSHILMYDWGIGEKIDDVALDIEKLDFKYDNTGGDKQMDWAIANTMDLTQKRLHYCRTNRYSILSDTILETPDYPEFVLIGEDKEKYEKHVTKYYRKYEDGYDPKKDGIWNVLWKSSPGHNSKIFPSVITYKELLTSQ